MTPDKNHSHCKVPGCMEPGVFQPDDDTEYCSECNNPMIECSCSVFADEIKLAEEEVGE